MNSIKRQAGRALGVYQEMVANSSALRAGLCWCWKCGRSEEVDSALCLRSGWPKCCNATMSLDRPPGSGAERAVDEAWERNE